jgi:hypothetical protein
MKLNLSLREQRILENMGLDTVGKRIDVELAPRAEVVTKGRERGFQGSASGFFSESKGYELPVQLILAICCRIRLCAMGTVLLWTPNTML